MAYFNEKLFGVNVRYNTYNVKFYAVVEKIHNW